MNFVGILGDETDVLKTGGVGTCVAIAIQYRDNQGPLQYALAHVPYDSDALVGNGQGAVDDYIDSVLACLGTPTGMSVRVFENTSTNMTGMIATKLRSHGQVRDCIVSSHGNTTQSVPRMNVVILRNASGTNGKVFCYASNKTEFRDESEAATDALARGTNLISVMDVMKRKDKHTFRRQVDLYGQARSSKGHDYSQGTNPYTLALKESNEANFSPVLADTSMFTRDKTEPWSKNKSKPALVFDYQAWETRIASKILRPLPTPFTG
ncbi:hypothetical protein [Corallococcus sp. 4LFB]|uniref:hypothetical protein n=1 Tax=Corallococcus sp. 4LFB TaxID=3383249 RepID=UPI003974FD92